MTRTHPPSNAERDPLPAEDRRTFLKRLAQAGVVVAGSGAAALWLHDRVRAVRPASAALPHLPDFRVALPAGTPRLAIAHGQDARVMLAAALDPLGGIGRFIQKGDVVVLKPNVGFDRPPSLGATTSPEVVGAMAALCREAGAARVLVTDNPINNPEGSFLKSRIRRAAETHGAEVVLPAPRHFREIAIDGEVLDQWSFFWEPFRNATKVIGLPTAKDHNLSTASLTMKNWYGLLGHGRNRFHQAIHEVIADLGHLMKPTLVVLDATRLLMRNGPTGGSPADVKPGHALAAGVDQVALDAWGMEMLGKDPRSVGYLALAEARGLGTRNWRSLSPPEIQTG